MAFRDIVRTQEQGMREMATSGVIGLHLVSGPLVGFAIGYGLDLWLNSGPVCKLVFLLIGIAAGFLNVWRDTRQLIAKINSSSPPKSDTHQKTNGSNENSA